MVWPCIRPMLLQWNSENWRYSLWAIWTRRIHTSFKEILSDVKLSDLTPLSLNCFLFYWLRIKLLFNIISGTAIGINTRTVMNNNYNLSEVILLKGKGRIIAIPPASSFKVLIESRVVNDSQFPLPLEKGIEIDVEIQNEKVILKKMQQI